MKAAKRILIVDDEPLNCELLVDLMTGFGHACETAHSGSQALEQLNSNIDLVLMDAIMPIMNGFEAARQIRSRLVDRDVPIIMVTALTDRSDRLRAVSVGANDFIAKPVDALELRVRTDAQLTIKESRDTLTHLVCDREATVKRRTADLRRTMEAMVEVQKSTKAAHLDTIRRLAIAADFKDRRTPGHLDRVSGISGIIARGLHLPEQETEIIVHAAAMHDVGMIGIPDAILLKSGRLNGDERAVMERHTVIGASLLSGSDSPLLRAGEAIALSHHEKWDGSGYPNGEKGEAIPLYGRICAIADVFDALISTRTYKDALLNEHAYAILQQGRASHFDPQLLDVFFACIDEVTAVQRKFAAMGATPELRAA